MVVSCSLSLPLYVNKRGGMFHFRMRVPKDIRGILSIMEISRALKTSNPREAFKKAQRLAWVMAVFFDDVREGKYMGMKDKEIKALVAEWLEEALEEDRHKRITRGRPRTIEEVEDEDETLSALEHDLRVSLATGNIKPVEAIARQILEESGLTLDDSYKYYKTLCYELLLGSVTCLKTLQERNSGKPEGYQQYLASTVVNVPDGERSAVDNSPLLSELVDDWVKDKMEVEENWTEGTKQGNVPMVMDFIEMIGDKPVESLTAEDMRDARERFMKIPKNRKQTKEYAEKSLRELSEMDIPKENRMTPCTLKNRATKVGAFLKWIKLRGYTIPDDLETVMKFKQKKRKLSEARAVFTREDLARIFNPNTYLEEVRGRQERLWVPLIGLCTGMRLEEICQLYLEDVREVKGILCFDVNGKKDKSVKTLAGHRLVPVSPVLKDLGIVEYIEMLKEKGEERLFPKLVKMKASDKYSSVISRWFNRYLDKIGIKDDKEEGSKVFHSFRHTFVNDCKQERRDTLMIKELVGHAGGGDITNDHYGKLYEPDVLFSEITSVVLPKIDLSELKKRTRE